MTIKVFTVAEMVAAERAADASGVSYDMMMETAGRRVAEAISERVPVRGRNVVVLVGPGNNGGDGLVAGRYLAQAGADVAIYLYKARAADEDANLRQVEEMGLFIVEAALDQRYRVLRTRLNDAAIVVDSLLGTGVTRPIAGNLAALMKEAGAAIAAARDRQSADVALLPVGAMSAEQMPAAAPYIVAVDCPSGLNCDTGELDKLALDADLTVTFAGPKRGHFYSPGAGSCGKLVVADININPQLPEVAQVPAALVTRRWAKELLPLRPIDGHKGTFGTVLIAAGSGQYWGAPLLSGRGAYRAGAGLVALAVPQAIRPTVASQLPEATYPAVPAEEVLDNESYYFLLSEIERCQALLVGPGLGPADAFLEALLAPGKVLPPLVVDADGLNALARRPGWQRALPPNTILTPHPGEMARLLGRSVTEVKAADRIKLALDAASSWGHIVLLKGAFTVVASPGGACAVQPFANPLMAVGGSGDVLAGIIAAQLAQGMAPFDAAVLGAYLHGAAAELAAEKFGSAGLLSGELADWVPAARRRVAGS
ncbi:MAG: NAD(P)H-hydrate dehydratase [Candidatus Promineifilaceae bacterium]